MRGRTVFKDRRDEVRAYLAYLFDFETTILRDKRKKRAGFFFKVAKANLFVMLYNLVESTTFICLEDIEQAFASNGLTHKKVTEKVRVEWLKQFCRDDRLRKTNQEDQHKLFLEVVMTVVEDKILQPLGTKNMTDSNINQHVIHSVSDRLGVAMTGGADGESLEIIRTLRNSLAHGNEKFSVIGSPYSVQDLEEHANKCFSFIERFVCSVESYIRHQRFRVKRRRRVAPPAPP